MATKLDDWAVMSLSLEYLVDLEEVQQRRLLAWVESCTEKASPACSGFSVHARSGSARFQPDVELVPASLTELLTQVILPPPPRPPPRQKEHQVHISAAGVGQVLRHLRLSIHTTTLRLHTVPACTWLRPRPNNAVR